MSDTNTPPPIDGDKSPTDHDQPKDNKAIPTTPAGPKLPWFQTPFGSRIAGGLLLAIAATIIIPAIVTLFMEVKSEREQEQELKDTAQFIYNDSLRRLDILDRLLKDAQTQAQIAERMQVVLNGSSCSNGITLFPRLRSLSLEDLYLHLQAMTNSHTTEPIDRITALRLLSWNLRDGISTFKDVDAIKTHVSGVTAELRAWIKGKDINGVTHFAKWAVTSDKQIRLNP